MIPGEVIPADGPPIELNAGRDELMLEVVNTGDRPVQVGSHFHFAEANPALAFERPAARGRHLAIPAGTSRRFEPGASEEVALIPFAGARYVAGFRGEVAGPLEPSHPGDSPQPTSHHDPSKPDRAHPDAPDSGTDRRSGADG